MTPNKNGCVLLCPKNRGGRRPCASPCRRPHRRFEPDMKMTSRSSSRHRERRSFHPPTACGFLSPQPACVESPASAEFEAICGPHAWRGWFRDARQSSGASRRARGRKTRASSRTPEKKTSSVRAATRSASERTSAGTASVAADEGRCATYRLRRGFRVRAADGAGETSEPLGRESLACGRVASGIFVGRKGGE